MLAPIKLFGKMENGIMCDDEFGKMVQDQPQPIPQNLLCFTAKEANSSIVLNKSGFPDSIELVYSTDKETWTDYTIGQVILLDNIDDKIYMRAKTSNATISKSITNYYKFTMTGKISVSGNIQFLLDKTGQRNNVPEYCYYYLFDGCASLVDVPELPGTILATYCYAYMFEDCTSLTIAPTLPAETLATYCYHYMFKGCTSLVEAPELLATTLVDRCYQYMFKGCTSLNYIKTHHTEWSPTKSTTQWVQSVSETGDFYCPSSLAQTRGIANIPENWTIHTFDEV